MPTFPYNLNTPNAPNSPSADQPKMRTNTNSIDALINVDHVSFESSTGNDGYHKVIHQAPFNNNSWDPFARTGGPAIIPGLNQLYSLFYTPDTTGGTQGIQLFDTNNGGTVQLTGSSAASDGWFWSGGLLIQWGKLTGFSGAWPTIPQTRNFKDRSTGAIPFPTDCFVVLTTFIGPTSNSTGDISINSISKTSFIWQFSGSSSASYDGFYWVAIGI